MGAFLNEVLKNGVTNGIHLQANVGHLSVN